ncbi:MAG UNVERIFIED_CONTAM: hypothetical protein LVT10_12435 [Anaerolineae bacterium]|jgi:purine-nucleoside phosphorylase
MQRAGESIILAGDTMVLNDHLYFAGLAGHNPLIGPNDDSLGPRFVGMVQSYDKSYRLMAEQVARDQQLPCIKGCMLAWQARCLNPLLRFGH